MDFDENGNEIPQAGTPASAPGNEEEVQGKTPEQIAEEAAAAATDTAAATTTPKEQGAEPTAAEKRIKQLVAEREEAKRREAYWQGVAQAKGGQPQTQVPVVEVPTTPPNPAEYEGGIYDVKYIEDHDKYLINMASSLAEKKHRDLDEADRASRVQTEFVTRMKTAAKDDPSIMSMMDDPSFFPHNIPAAGPLVALIKDSEEAPGILKHLFENRDELDSLYRMNPLAAAREIGKLESKIVGTKTVVRKVSQAPAPIQTVGGAGASTIIDDDDKLTTKEFMERRNIKQFKRGAR